MNTLTIEDLLAELHQEEEDIDFDLSLAGAWIRYAYGQAYMRALEQARPDIQQAIANERAAWAQLP